MQYAATHGVELLHVEVTLQYDTLEEIQLLEFASPLFDEQGQTSGCVAAFLDITDRKQAEAGSSGKRSSVSATSRLHAPDCLDSPA